MASSSIHADAVHRRCLRCAFRVPEICDRACGHEGDATLLLCGRESPSDAELIARHQRERQQAQPATSFALLFERHHRHVVAWACRISGNFELALDLAQDVFVKLFTRLDAFREESRFTTWLYTVTRNVFHDYVRARASRPREVGDAALVSAGPVTANEGLARLEAEETRRLAAAIVRDARLDEMEKRVLTMRFRDDMTLNEITDALGLANASGAKAPIVSATRKLRAAAARWTVRDRASTRARAASGRPSSAIRMRPDPTRIAPELQAFAVQ